MEKPDPSKPTEDLSSTEPLGPTTERFSDIKPFSKPTPIPDKGEEEQLFVFEDDREIGRYALGKSEQIRIGRQEGETEIHLPSGTISKIHCVITFREDGYYLMDNHSKNGTVLNRVLLQSGELQPLKDGDLIYLSQFTILVKMSQPNLLSPEDAEQWLNQHSQFPQTMGSGQLNGISPSPNSRDFTCIHSLESGRWGICLGSLSGSYYGVRSEGIREIVDTLQIPQNEESAAAILNKMDHHIRHEFPQLHLRIIYALVKPDIPSINLAIAGQPSPILFSPDRTPTISPLPLEDTLPLGSTSNPHFEEGELQIRPGDGIVLASKNLLAVNRPSTEEEDERTLQSLYNALRSYGTYSIEEVMKDVSQIVYDWQTNLDPYGLNRLTDLISQNLTTDGTTLSQKVSDSVRNHGGPGFDQKNGLIVFKWS